jgi:hypothetical protein
MSVSGSRKWKLSKFEQKGKNAMRAKALILCLALGLIPLRAQAPDALDVEGIRGRIQVQTVADRSGTFIHVQAADQRHPVVLVLQYGDKAKLLPDWTGNGTLYMGKGLVAIVGEDGTKRMAKFPNLPVPASLVKLSLDNFEIVGVARYGESTPLSEKQLANLRSLGLCNATAGAPDSRQAVSPLQVEGCHGTACTSGGEGATSCSTGGGGCSVTCTTGWYACCNGNTNNCRCCKYAP